jgi:phosphoesterase RecJ-like protein
MGLNDVKNALRKYDRFLITSHRRPEGDSIGSEMAMCLLLKKLGKEAVVVNDDLIPENLDFLKFYEVKTLHQAKRMKFDVVIVLDSGNLERIGRVVNLIQSKPLVNIDHHISNAIFGDVNWVDVEMSSVSEMIFYLFKEMQIPFDEQTALCIYVGILTDTGSFRFSNTTSRAMRVCSELLEFKIEPEKVSNLIYNRRSFNAMRLLGYALSNLKKDSGGEIAWMEITPQMLKETDAQISECDDFIDFIRVIKSVKVAIIFYPLNNDRIKVSFRSKGEIDVNKIASFFNGGGHKLASGAEIEGSIEEVEELVLKKVKEQLKKP